MLTFLLDPGMMPFTGALLLVAGLALVELVMASTGGSLIGDAGDGADGADGAEADLDAGGADGAHDADGADGDHGPADEGGLAAWLGFGEVPFVLWAAGLLTAFGLAGYALQSLAVGVLGGQLPAALAAPVALVPGLWGGRWFARLLARLVPKTETTAIALASLGDRRGVIVQGTAARGRPAQARVADGFGNMHFVRVEPVDDGIEIPPGTEILTRRRNGPVLGAIPLDDI